jgi:hypothetical protein
LQPTGLPEIETSPIESPSLVTVLELLMSGVTAVLDELRASIDALNQADLQSLDSHELGDLVERVGRLRNSIDAANLAATHAFEYRGRWRADGARTAKAWIRTTLRLRASDAASQIANSRALPHMPLVTDALQAGQISPEHVAWFTRARSPERSEMFARDEHLLVDHARTLSFAHFSKAIRYWITLANEMLGLDEPDPRQSRTASSAPSGDDMWEVKAELDALDGTEFDNELRRLEQIEFDNDWAEAHERLGDSATVADLARTVGQRLADALLEMARRSAGTTKPGDPAKRVLKLRMDFGTFIAEMAELNGQPKPPPNPDRVSETEAGTIVAPSRILAPNIATHVRRTVFGPDSHVLDFGRSQRLYSGGLREAIIERDQECTQRYCDTPGRHCQVDHIEEWEDNGHTNEINGKLLCPAHNRQKHIRKRAGPKAPVQ